MARPLSELSLEELWQLFPIELTRPDPNWKDWFREEKKELQRILSISNIKIEHIGSTAVKDIWAKPIVDILIEVPESYSLRQVKDILESHGYLTMNCTDTRVDLNKGYTPEGFADRVFHIHLRDPGDHDELYFRDYLNSHPDTAKEYEKLKLALWPRFEFDRDGYTEAKTSFVTSITEQAKKHYFRETNE